MDTESVLLSNPNDIMTARGENTFI